MNSVYITGLFLGLGASLHCLGMCGPLVMAMPLSSPNKSNKFGGSVLYILGKTTTYALMGALVGLVGISIQAMQWMQILSIISGIIIIILAWEQYIRLPFGAKVQQLFLRFSSTSIAKIKQSNIPVKGFFFGILNGLLPCGLVYIALINSLLAGGPIQAAGAMIFFGLGTAPILLATKFLFKKISFKSNRLTPILVTIVGALIIIRGLNLGIPYISPKIEDPTTSNTTSAQQPQATMSCCSSKSQCEE